MTRSPTLVAAFCAAAVVALLLSVAASSAGESKLGCTVLAAKVGILSAKLPKKVKLDATGRSGAGIDEIDPLYAADGTDPNCCPSRGYDHTLYRWKSGKFVVGRTWHTRSP